MIRIGAAFLCEAASIREGLLHVLGGELTLLGRPNYPAPMDVVLAVILYVRQPSGAPVDYKLNIALRSVATGKSEQVAVAESHVELTMPGEHSSVMILPLAPVGIPEPGEYAIDLVVGDGDTFSVPFTAGLTVQTEDGTTHISLPSS